MAYAVLASLFTTTQKMLNPDPYRLIPCNKATIQSLHQNIHSLMSFLENTPSHKYQTTKSLEANIIDVGYKAEDVLESYITKHSRSLYKLNENDEVVETDDRDDEKDENDVIMLSESLVEVIKGFESLIEQMNEIQSYVNFGGVKVEQMASLSVAGSSRLASTFPSDDTSKPTSSGKNKFVLLDVDFMNQIKDQLFYGEKLLKVIPLVGMGGIGKTTLAKALIEDPFTSRHFDVRGWVTISQQYNIKDVVEKLLEDIKADLKKKIGDDKVADLNTEYDAPKHHSESRQQLHKTLYGRRYFVVLDDLWDTEACDELLKLFPDWNNGSRIIVTTRQSRVATFATNSYHEMKLLNGDTSWDLLRQVVFPKEGNMACPPELMEIGKEIAMKCSGLPLTISVIGGLLSKEKMMTVQHWERVAENMKSALTEEGDQCLEILSLSYNHLPHHLKACFLYLGIYPEDHEIPVSEVLLLWMAEGFLKPGSTNMKKVAKENLKDLIERNLILVEELNTYSGKPVFLKLHDLLRDLCIREARKEKFLYVLKDDMDLNGEEARGHRRLSILPSSVEGGFDVRQSMPGIRSFICFEDSDYEPLNYFGCELLRVLYMPPDDKIEDELLQPLNLRLFGSPRVTENANWIFNLWDLQYFFIFIDQISYLPQCIWFMPQLRHLRASAAELPLLPPKTERPICVLERLEVLSTIKEFRCDDEVLVRIPNLRKLRIYYDDEGKDKALDWSYYRLDNLVKMTKLESLKCEFFMRSAETLLANLAFPLSLQKLSLSGCNISWEHMDIIGVLPNLKDLNLRRNAFRGQTWETSDNHFKKLEYLTIDLLVDSFSYDGLKEWIVEDANHFPSLRYLHIVECGHLKEIPTSIGEIPTLETIEFFRCSESVASSARNIQDEINNDLKLVIGFIIPNGTYY